LDPPPGPDSRALRGFYGYDDSIRLWGYDGNANHNSLQTSLSRRFDNGFMFQAYYVWSKTLTDSNDDFTAGRPNASKEEVRRADWSYANYDRPHTFVLNLVYQTGSAPSVACAHRVRCS
jgi:hypothetical protein